MRETGREETIHSWDVSVEQAIQLQERMRPQVQQTNHPPLDQIHTVVGLDASYRGVGRAAVAVYSFPALEGIEQATAVTEITFPYIPDLLSFREGPVVLAAMAKLTTEPDLLLFDGHGYAHPRRFGLACHLGVYLDRPSIGCAKSRLIGSYDAPGPRQGDCSPLIDEGEVIGMVVRTRPQTSPVFVSVGHKIDLPTAVTVVLRCVRGRRLPEPIRAADHLANSIT